MRQPKVFTSYSHDSQSHKDKVLALSDRLRDEGVDSHIDQYEVVPPEGWPVWTRRQIMEADLVLVICTETYLRRFEGREVTGKGLGARWEGGLITQELYESQGRNNKFIPVVFSPDDVKYIPAEMRGGTYYILDSESEYEDLYRHLTDQPKTIKRELGKLRSLPPLERKQDYMTRGISADRDIPTVAAAEPSAPSPVNSAQTTPRKATLIFIVSPEGVPLFVEAQRIRSGVNLQLTLVPSDPREAAALSDLRRGGRNPIGVAYNMTAMFARVKSIEQIVEGGQEIWDVELQPDEEANRGPGMLGNFSMSGHSPDEIAERRAKLILLNEKNRSSARRGSRDLNAELLEHSVQGRFGSSHYQIISSPFPALFKAAAGNIDEFLEAAKLNAVLLLKLTHTVEHIHRLNLRMQGEAELHVDFEGQRPAEYVNHEPHIIQFEGKCQLREK